MTEVIVEEEIMEEEEEEVVVVEGAVEAVTVEEGLIGKREVSIVMIETGN